MLGELIGREWERNRLLAVLRERKSLLILGPRGIGKSVLLDSVLMAGDKPIRLPFSPSLHYLLIGIAEQLGRKSSLTYPKLTSVRLRGVVLSNLAEKPRCIVVEDVENAGSGLFRFGQQLFHLQGVSLLVTARSRAQLGRLQRLFWNPADIVQLTPLSSIDSNRLFVKLGAQYRLHPDQIEELRRAASRTFRGNPGRIAEMCRLAADERYRRDSRILTASICMEVATRFLA